MARYRRFVWPGSVWWRVAWLTAGVVALLLAPVTSTVRAQPALTASVTLGVFADFARQVGGDRVEVIQLIPDGVDVHSYQMTPTDLTSVHRSQVFLHNGFDLEPFAAQLGGGGRPELARVGLAEGLTPIMHGRQANPHFWLDPRLAASYVARIRDAFTAADPAGAETYRVNADRYLATLQTLDADLEQQLGEVAPQNRKLIVSHDAFTYLARRYGFEEIASVLSTEAQEPSPSELIALIRQVRQAGVRTMFVEPQLTSRLTQQVAREAGLQTLPLYSDAFPPDGSIRTYADMMRANSRNIVDGLR
jgi:ABC-type Zn uptake system ZnuABC Zn-binding protein ZnuA